MIRTLQEKHRRFDILYTYLLSFHWSATGAYRPKLMTCKPPVQLHSVRHKMITMRDKYDGGQGLCLLLPAIKASPGSSRDWPKPDRRLLKLWRIPSASFWMSTSFKRRKQKEIASNQLHWSPENLRQLGQTRGRRRCAHSRRLWRGGAAPCEGTAYHCQN